MVHTAFRVRGYAMTWVLEGKCWRENRVIACGSSGRYQLRLSALL